MDKKVQIEDKEFELYLREQEIQKSIREIAKQINRDYADKEVVFLGVLNGCFMFASDLLKHIDLSCAISFIKMESYQGTSSSGMVHELIGLTTDIDGKHVVVLEDIVDTGNTLRKIFSVLEKNNAASIEIATLLLKPDVFQGNRPKYVGLEIPSDFIIGYGMDYNQRGRNFKDIYKIVK